MPDNTPDLGWVIMAHCIIDCQSPLGYRHICVHFAMLLLSLFSHLLF